MNYSHCLGPCSVLTHLPWTTLLSSPSPVLKQSLSSLLLRVQHPSLRQLYPLSILSPSLLFRFVQSFPHFCKHGQLSDLLTVLTLLQILFHLVPLQRDDPSINICQHLIELLKKECQAVQSCPVITSVCIQILYLLAHLCRYGRLFTHFYDLHCIRHLRSILISRLGLFVLPSRRSPFNDHYPPLLPIPIL